MKAAFIDVPEQLLITDVFKIQTNRTEKIFELNKTQIILPLVVHSFSNSFRFVCPYFEISVSDFYFQSNSMGMNFNIKNQQHKQETRSWFIRIILRCHYKEFPLELLSTKEIVPIQTDAQSWITNQATRHSVAPNALGSLCGSSFVIICLVICSTKELAKPLR